MGFLRADALVKRYAELTVVDGVSLEAERGEFVVFVGPSGCGKSTLLRMVAGLEEVTDGRVFIDGTDVTDLHPAKRGVAMVFQSYALYPHMTVAENIGFGLKMNGMAKPEVEARIARAAAILQLGPLLARKPRQLSGGQRQRVAIGRAIVRDPKLFLFDEPLSNLDAELRAQMRVEIARLHREIGVTMVYVTHDQVEAMTLADRIVVLRAGKVEQIGTPTELYERPANSFVAGFIGSPKMNFLATTVAAREGSRLTLRHPALAGDLSLTRAAAGHVVPGSTVTLGLRPEHLHPGAAPARLNLVGEFAESLGGTSQIYAQPVGETPEQDTLVLSVAGRCTVAKGEALPVGFDPAQVYLFDGEGRAVW
jgi:multiple sugar transport system ATP-binding protein/lactose/L-arabinose transport system ATP-binding protein